MRKLLAYFLLIFLFISTGCDDTSSLGTDLLADQKFDLKFTDDFEFTGSLILGDSILTHNRNSDQSTYLLGDVENDIFGKSNSEIYVKLLYNSNISKPAFDSITVDSVVFSFLFDTIGFYGNPISEHNLQLFEMEESIADFDSIFSNQQFSTLSNSFADKTFVPNPYDSLTVQDFENQSFTRVRPHLRIKLEDSEAQTLIERLVKVDSDSSLVEEFKGFKIKSTVANKDSYIGLNFSNTSNLTSGINGMKVYYSKTNPDTMEEEYGTYTFLYSTTVSNYYNQEYTGSLVGQAFSNKEILDSLMFLQSQQGLKSELTIPKSQLEDINDKLINFAEIIVTIAELPEDNLAIYEPLSFIIATEYDDEDKLVFTSDVNKSFAEHNNFITGFGGGISNIDGKMVYKCNVTSFLKEQIEKGVDFNIVLEAAGKSQTSKRTVIYGAKHSEYAPKLRVTYTDIN